MYTSQLLSLTLDAGETETELLAKEIRGTGNENETRGAVSGAEAAGGTQVKILSFVLLLLAAAAAGSLELE